MRLRVVTCVTAGEVFFTVTAPNEISCPAAVRGELVQAVPWAIPWVRAVHESFVSAEEPSLSGCGCAASSCCKAEGGQQDQLSRVEAVRQTLRAVLDPQRNVDIVQLGYLGPVRVDPSGTVQVV